jgi:small subunit ribosomal protein S8
MTELDIVSNLFSAIQNSENARKSECLIAPTSKTAGNVLRVLQKEGYIGEFEFIDDGRGGKFRIQLLGRVNRCGSIKPRFPVKSKNLLNWVRNYLPSRDMGIVILSTSKGLLTHKECLGENIGGLLIGYLY